MSGAHVRDMHASNNANNLGEVEKVMRKMLQQYGMNDTDWMSSDRQMEREREIFIILNLPSVTEDTRNG